MAKSINGTYTVQFRSSLGGFGAGVVTLNNLNVSGGDSGFIFSGNFRENGDELHGIIHVQQHTSGIPSIFGNIKSFDLSLKGMLDGRVGHFSGNIVQQPSMRINIALCRAAMAAE